MTDASATLDTAVQEPPRPDMRSLSDILDALEHAGEDGHVSVGDVLGEVGIHSFAPVILVPALILVSPLSGIFGLPTIGAIIMFLITIQKLFGRPHIWVPKAIQRREIKEQRLAKAVAWLRGPVGWVDRRTRERLTVLVHPPTNIVTLLLILGICLVIPALELLPFVTSIFALAISFMAMGLLARDGLFTLLGYLQIGLNAVLILWLVGWGG